LKNESSTVSKVIKQGSVVFLKSSDGKEIKVACGVNAADAQSLKMDGAFAEALLGKSEGDKVDFGNGFEVVKID
jgi:transcription elongation GreA/GreB family factor